MLTQVFVKLGMTCLDMIKTALDREHVIFRTEEPQTLEVVQIIYCICGCQIVLKLRRSKQLSIMVYLLDFLLRFENSGKKILLQFWSKILNFVNNWWLCKIAVMNDSATCTWCPFKIELESILQITLPKKQYLQLKCLPQMHLINIIEDSFGFLCWLGLVNQRISSFIASAIKL